MVTLTAYENILLSMCKGNIDPSLANIQKIYNYKYGDTKAAYWEIMRAIWADLVELAGKLSKKKSENIDAKKNADEMRGDTFTLSDSTIFYELTFSVGLMFKVTMMRDIKIGDTTYFPVFVDDVK